MHEGCREPTDGDSAEAMGRLASGCASSIRLGRLLGCRQDALALFVTLLTGPLSPCAGERHCFRRRKRRKNASSPGGTAPASACLANFAASGRWPTCPSLLGARPGRKCRRITARFCCLYRRAVVCFAQLSRSRTRR
ncbi:unnamed protein product, partial [Ixodes persulcatus]